MARRWLIIPELFPNSVVFFHYRNDKRAPGRSWRFRDYSSGQEDLYKPDRWPYPYTHAEILEMGVVLPDKAEAIPVDRDYWPSETRKLNRKYAHLLGG